MLNGMLWVVRTGAPWRDLPERYGPWQTVYDYFSTWRQSGVLDQILEALQIRLDADGHIDWDLWCVDGSSIRASRAAAGASKKAASDTVKSPKTMHWVARAADSGANCTWSLTARAYPSPSKSVRGKSTNRRALSRS
jgi:transposase